ncbi:MAG: hypothetical protein ACLUHE_11515 [Christensenellales bacterium]
MYTPSAAALPSGKMPSQISRPLPASTCVAPSSMLSPSAPRSDIASAPPSVVSKESAHSPPARRLSLPAVTFVSFGAASAQAAVAISRKNTNEAKCFFMSVLILRFDKKGL